MRNQSFHDLRNQIKILSNKEFNSLTKQISNSKLSKEASLYLRFIEQCKSKRKLDVVFWKNSLNPKGLKYLKKNIEDLFFLREDFGYDLYDSKRKIYSGIIKKQLILAVIYLDRGLINEMQLILKRITSSARKYELYTELCEILRLRLSVLIDQEKLIEGRQLKLELHQATSLRNSEEQIKDIVDSFDLSLDQNFSQEEVSELLLKTLSKIESIIKNYPTANNKAYYFLSKLLYFERTSDYDSYIKLGEYFVKFTLNEISVYSKNNLIFLKNKIAKYYIYQFKFTESKRIAIEAMQLIGKKRNTGYLRILKTIILSNFYSNSYSLNEKHFKNLYRISNLKGYKNRLAEFYYYEAINLYLMLKFREARLALNKIEDFDIDKYEWNAWVRLLRIMITMELKKWDLVEYQIKANAKYLAKNRVHIRPRVHLIHKLLNALISNNFDFKQTADKKADLLSGLENDSTVQWNINSPELIQFHNWFKAKREGTVYQAVFHQQSN